MSDKPTVKNFDNMESGKYTYGQLGYKNDSGIEWKSKGRHMTILKRKEGVLVRLTLAGFDFSLPDHVVDDTKLDNGKVIFKLLKKEE